MMTTILRFILFFLLAPAFAILAQAAVTFQDGFRIVGAEFRTESFVLDNLDGEICNYESSGALLQQCKSIDGVDGLSRYQGLKISGVSQPLFSFLSELVATNKITTPRVNKLSPDPDAVGPHSSFKTNQQGKVTGYETYDTNPRTGQFTPEKRFRGEGGPHGNVDPPFVLERKPGKGPGSTPVVPRPATPEELPNGY